MHQAPEDEATRVLALARCFALPHPALQARPFGGGHINDTWRLELENGQAVLLQRINTQVFERVDVLMANLCRVLDHLWAKTEDPRKVMRLGRTLSGECCLKTESNDVWRCLHFIEKTRCLRRSENLQQAFEAGRAFGEFQAQLRDLPAPALEDSLPGFHEMPLRWAPFERAVASDPFQRVEAVASDIDFALQNRGLLSLLSEGLPKGEMPRCITHNDAKLENLLFDQDEDKALCVIDLDTVQMGVALFDFGDLARSAASSACEEGDPESVEVVPDRFKALRDGFLEGRRGLTAFERRHMVQATQAFAYTLGLRFLTDYLLGDVYFRVKHREENRQRARGQFTLLKSLMRQEASLR